MQVNQRGHINLSIFSSRTDWNLTPNALHQLLEEKRKRGESILDLTESNPTRCGFSHNPEILQALSSNRSLLYEPDPRGLLAARKSIADHYNRPGVLIDPSNIFLTASTSEAYTHLFRLLCNPGANVLVPKPSYPLFDYLCALNDVEVRYYRLRYDDEWQIDLDSIEDSIDASTRALLLVHPNNPTGSFVKKTEKDAVAKIIWKHNLALIVDEVFSEFSFEDVADSYGSFVAEKEPLVFTLNGISKLLGLPQMKLAWITISGESTLAHDAVDRLEIICDTYLSVGTPIQQALPVLLDNGRRITEEIKKRIKTNYCSLRSMTANSSASLLRTDGGWNAIVRLPGIVSDESWALRTLEDYNVFVHPGHFFEIEQDACIVVSLLPEESTFSNGIDRLLASVRSTISLSV